MEVVLLGERKNSFKTSYIRQKKKFFSQIKTTIIMKFFLMLVQKKLIPSKLN